MKPILTKKHLHQLTYQCPQCSIRTIVNTRLIIPPPGCQFPPNPVLRMEPVNLACHHGEVPLPVVHSWLTQILQTFNFEAGYTLINPSAQTIQFAPNPKPKP